MKIITNQEMVRNFQYHISCKILVTTDKSEMNTKAMQDCSTCLQLHLHHFLPPVLQDYPLLPDFFLDEFDAAAVEQAQQLGAKPKFFEGKTVESDKPKAAGGQVAQV